MTTSDKKDVKPPQAALANYLDELLRCVTEPVSAQPAPVVLPREVPVAAPVEDAPELDRSLFLRTLKQAPPVAPAPEAPPVVSPPVAPPPVAAPVVPVAAPVAPAPVVNVAVPEPVAPAQAAPEAPMTLQRQGWTDGRPDWAQGAFECLIFRVGGLELAVPLVLLGAIHKIDQPLREIPGRPNWFMGLYTGTERNIRVVDTARWVMGKRYPDDARERYRYIIRLNGSDWGLACDEVAESRRLTPAAVKWRAEESRRPWLAGTVLEQMCALMDAGALSDLLEQAERNRVLDLDSPLARPRPAGST